MSTTLMSSSTRPNLTRSIAGSIVGGMVFGMLMQMMSMMGMVAALVNSKSTGVGWGVHLAISMIFGLGFYIALRILPLRAPGAILGLMYGVILWVVGSMILMPTKLHMPIFHFDGTAMKSLMGHMIFGLILGVAATSGKVTANRP